MLTLVLFFGLIGIAQYRVQNCRWGDGIKLVVSYKGDQQIGSTLSLKGKKFLIKNGLSSVRDEGILERLYGFYAALPEVENVLFIRREYPRKIEVKMVIREPFVKVGQVYFDRYGCRLSKAFNKLAAKRQIPAVEGLKYPRVLNPGDVWENIYFKEVLRSLHAVEEKLVIKRVVLPTNRRNGLGRIVLQTTEGAMICWGKVFQEGMETGLGVDNKVRNLDEALKIIASNMSKVKYVDISHEKPVIAY